MAHRKSIDVITLGCSKNLVDTERLLKRLSDLGFTPRHDPDPDAKPSRIVIINTCGFIADAKEESINTILEYCQKKEFGEVDEVIVMGCLSQRYLDTLPDEIPEVDKFYGKFDIEAVIADLAARNSSKTNAKVSSVSIADETAPIGRTVTTLPSHAYLKIAEGCDRFCAFCAIPLITGRFRSRPLDEILAEVEELTRQGYTEFNVIAQDLSSYGKDIYGEKSLAKLIEAIAENEAVKRIRLHYAYPADFPYDILPIMRNNPKVCKYLDIALQHIADPVLANMRRHFSSAETRKLINKLRREVPGIHIRTTLMVGFPGEGEKEFEQLLDFVRETRFERMGAFAYSEEEDTYAAKHLPDVIDEHTKQQRLDRLMALQEEISMEIQEAKVGQTFEVVIDREEDDYYVGRTEFDSPEVDPEVLIEKIRPLEIGQYYKVQIQEALPFELIGKPV